VALAPHLGSATRSSRLGMAMLAARNLIAYARSEPLPTCLNAAAIGPATQP
jgi:glyoxylate reductase